MTHRMAWNPPSDRPAVVLPPAGGERYVASVAVTRAVPGAAAAPVLLPGAFAPTAERAALLPARFTLGVTADGGLVAAGPEGVVVRWALLDVAVTTRAGAGGAVAVDVALADGSTIACRAADARAAEAVAAAVRDAWVAA